MTFDFAFIRVINDIIITDSYVIFLSISMRLTSSGPYFTHNAPVGTLSLLNHSSYHFLLHLF